MAGRPLFGSAAEFAAARSVLVKDIEAKVARYGNGDGGKALDIRVLDVIGRIPREEFVPEMERADAYANRPLPIGHRQTISQPLIVAYMTHHLQLLPTSKVLEIGTGSGYQTAILAEFAGEVVTVENVATLAVAAKTRLTALGYRNIRFIQGDGRLGCPDETNIDRIIVTAASEAIPPALLDQLAPSGRLVMPVGGGSGQHLVLVIKDISGNIEERRLFPVDFVPLTHGCG